MMISSSFFSLPCFSSLNPEILSKKRPLIYSTSPLFIPLLKPRNNQLKIANSGSDRLYCGPQYIHCGPQEVEAVNRLRRRNLEKSLRAALKVLAGRNKGPSGPQ